MSAVVCVARKPRPCPSYSRRRDRNNCVHWRSLYKGGGGTWGQCGVAWRDVAWCVTSCGVAWGVLGRGACWGVGRVAWRGVAWRGAVWCGVAWHWGACRGVGMACVAWRGAVWRGYALLCPHGSGGITSRTRVHTFHRPYYTCAVLQGPIAREPTTAQRNPGSQAQTCLRSSRRTG